MVDRRYVISALSALLGTAAGEAVARPRKKAVAKHGASHSTKGKKGKTSHLGHSRHHAPAEVEEMPREPAPPPEPAETSPEAAAALKSAFDLILHDTLAAQPTTLTSLGLDTGEWAYQKSRLEDRSEAGKAATTARLKKAVAALNAIDRNMLAGTDRINYDTVLWDYGAQLSVAQDFAYGDFGTYAGGFANPYVISQLSGAYQFIPDFLDTQHTVKTQADAEAYLARLDAFAKALDDETQRARNDFGRGVVPPDFILNTAIKQLTALRDTDPASSTLINSLVTRTAQAGIAGTWQADATARVTGPVREALTRQIELLTGVLPKARHDASVRYLPGGDAYYALCARTGTSTDMTPKDIHALGLDTVARLSDEIDRRLRAQGMSQGTPGERMRAM
ncbi:MAG: DUF885 family protein, partial [Asticcacaulis sp.]